MPETQFKLGEHSDIFLDRVSAQEFGGGGDNPQKMAAQLLSLEVPRCTTYNRSLVHLDRSLAFQTHHVEYVTKKVEQRCRILACLASKEWGWRKKHLRQVYITTQRTVLDYAAPAWQPWLSNTSMNKLETAQNAALRLVTGQYRSTPVEALRKKSSVESYKIHSKKILATASEKADRLGL